MEARYSLTKSKRQVPNVDWFKKKKTKLSSVELFVLKLFYFYLRIFNLGQFLSFKSCLDQFSVSCFLKTFDLFSASSSSAFGLISKRLKNVQRKQVNECNFVHLLRWMTLCIDSTPSFASMIRSVFCCGAWFSS